jgi:predicted permease
MRLFGGQSGAVGASIVLNQRSRVVVGVLPPGTTLAPDRADEIDVWLPMGLAEEFLGEGIFASPTARSFRASARLREGVGADDLAPELARVGAAVASDYPGTLEGWAFRADALRDRVIGRSEGPVMVLLLGGILFCCVALVNLTALFHQRSLVEARSTTIRLALGATSGDVRRARVADGVVLGGLAAGVASALGYVGFRSVDTFQLLALPDHVALDWRWTHVVVTGALAVSGALVVGAISSAVAGSGRGADSRTPAWRGVRPRNSSLALGVLVALSMSLTVGALAMLRSWNELRGASTGILTEGVLTARMEVPRELMLTPDGGRGAREVVERIRELPGVTHASVWSPEIPTDAHTFTRALLESAPGSEEREPVLARYHTISAGAASAIGLRFVTGRDMSAADVSSGRRVALVSASAAVAWWGGTEAAVGQRMRRPAHSEWSDVVGVVADAPLSGRFGPGSENTLDVFFAFDQDPRATFVVLVHGDPLSLDQDDLRGAASVGFPGVPIYDFRWMDDRIREQERMHRSTAALGSVYAAMSLLLAAVGLVSSTLLLLGRRRAEVGVRQVLGGTRARVAVEVLRGNIVAVAVGIVAGSLLARQGLSWIDPVVLRVGPSDVVSHLGAAATLAASAVLAFAAGAVSSVRADLARSLATMERA